MKVLSWKCLFQKKIRKTPWSLWETENLCSRLYKKERKRPFNNFNSSLLTKLFWDTVKLLFSSNGNYGAYIKLVEKNEVLQDSDPIQK